MRGQEASRFCASVPKRSSSGPLWRSADPVRAHRRAGRQHLLQHDVALEGTCARGRRTASATSCRSSRARPTVAGELAVEAAPRPARASRVGAAELLVGGTRAPPCGGPRPRRQVAERRSGTLRMPASQASFAGFGGHGMPMASRRRRRSCPSERSHTSASASGVHGSVPTTCAQGRGMREDRDLRAAHADDLTRDVGRAVAREVRDDGRDGVGRRGGRGRAPVAGQTLRHARVGGRRDALQRTPYFAIESAVDRVSPTMPSFAAE